MLDVHDIEALRRSHAMAPLSAASIDELLETCAALARQRRQIAELLGELPASVAQLRHTLNQLARIVAT